MHDEAKRTLLNEIWLIIDNVVRDGTIVQTKPLGIPLKVNKDTLNEASFESG